MEFDAVLVVQALFALPVLVLKKLFDTEGGLWSSPPRGCSADPLPPGGAAAGVTSQSPLRPLRACVSSGGPGGHRVPRTEQLGRTLSPLERVGHVGPLGPCFSRWSRAAGCSLRADLHGPVSDLGRLQVSELEEPSGAVSGMCPAISHPGLATGEM